jgi:hypothetical protein
MVVGGRYVQSYVLVNALLFVSYVLCERETSMSNMKYRIQFSLAQEFDSALCMVGLDLSLSYDAI